MASETLYRKVGRRYQPVSEYERYSGSEWPKGSHVVICEPGSTLIRYSVEPDKAPLIVALEVYRNDLANVLRKAVEARPKDKPYTPRQRKAIQAMLAEMGDDVFYIQWPSIHDVIDALYDALLAKVS